ncbi:hypothetical protein HDV01_000650 [Terramyces sp. JEL0728]|nr:hypothetical protein HDV01_000650 [Terramyces sp. JEL0728]
MTTPELCASANECHSDDEIEINADIIAEYNKKKASKPKVVAKSIISLDVKPWDDETDMQALTESVKNVAMEGLLWGTHKVVPIGYGISKLTITCVVVDDLVGTDDLTELIMDECQDHVSSIEIASFNKL